MAGKKQNAPLKQTSKATVKEQTVATRSTGTNAPGKKTLIILLAIIAFFLYSGTFSNRFVLDDHGIIKTNNITKAPVSWENTKIIFTTPLRAGSEGSENSLYRPLTKLIFNIEWNLFDGNPHAFHIVNAGAYALLCVLIFAVLYETFKKDWLVPFATTLLFIVHPLHVEAVANIKSLDEILGLLGIIGSLRCIQQYLSNLETKWVMLSYLSFLVALFSKESAIVGVMLFPLFIYFFSNVSTRKNLLLSAGFVACGLLLILSRWSVLHDLKQTPLNAYDNLLILCNGPAERFATAIYLLGYYILKFLIPYPLSCDYSYSSIMPVTLHDPAFIVSFLILSALLFFAVRGLRRKDPTAFGIIWFFCGISIVSNIFFLIGTSFGERLMFLPSLGLCLVVVVVLRKYLGRTAESAVRGSTISAKSLFGAIIAGVCVCYSIISYSRSKDWESDYGLYSRDIRYYPNSIHLLYYMGTHLSTTERKEVLTDKLSELGFPQQKIDDSSKAENRESILYFNNAIKLIGMLPPEGYNQLGKAYNTLGNVDSARKYFGLAYKADSTNATYINNIGTLYYTNNQMLEALPFFRRAWQADTMEPAYMNNIGCVHGATGKPDSAIYWFNKALAKDPDNVISLKFLEMTWRNKGNTVLADKYKMKLQEHQ
jgi:tetratricopeptide (TPR) repeat protein